MGSTAARELCRRFSTDGFIPSLAFSKKLDNLAAAAALYVAYHNFCWIPRKLRITPAMAAGVAGHALELDELLAAIA